MPLRDPQLLHEPVTPGARVDIFRSLWPDRSPQITPEHQPDLKAYFSYYTKECNKALLDEGQYLSARTHEDFLRIATLLRTKSDKEEIKLEIRRHLTAGRSSKAEDKILESTINLVTRLLAMINVGPLQNEISPQWSIPWHEGSLDKAVHAHFNNYLDTNCQDDVLQPHFTLRNFDRDANISIIWTNNLVDHLRLVNKDKGLCVFHQVSFLKWIQKVSRSATHLLPTVIVLKVLTSPMYPKGFIEETIDTLTLLLPDTDRRTRHWLECELQDYDLTGVDLNLRHLGSFKANDPARRLEHFKFWRERLGVLKDVVEEETPYPKVLLRVLHDRKQGDRWLNSWVALVAISLTLVFGLVQSIEGAIQVYKAYHPTTV
ncbi:hypothetical protein HBI62_170630 [Parastagonospora nodorum]|nr:hypothetical protein HBI62_170630 [Parastagonospora nodorum]KAH6148996.1 hypothetical protein HBI63_146250 [Parastagonospora nodorum]KAH6175916.1 hypothetical protein HBI61_138460 [Parastagonospora nodorum]